MDIKGTKFIFATILITFVLISYYLIFFNNVKSSDQSEIDFGCGNMKVLTMDNGKPKKHIYVVEGLVKGHPHLSCRMWDTYDRAAKLALQIFNAKDPSYQPVIHFINSQSENADPLRPAKIISEAAGTDALAVVGFAWSTMAGIAAEQAKKEKVPYISPTAVIKSVFDGEYSVSLGTPLGEAVRGFRRLTSKLEEPDIVIAEATDQIQEREYSDGVRAHYPKAESIQYQDAFPVDQIIASLSKRQGTNHLLFVPGYTSVKDGIRKILSAFPATTIVVGPQWSHDHRLLDFDGSLYCVSDYFNLIKNTMHDTVTDGWLKGGGEIIGGYLYSLFDALMFTLMELDDREINSREVLIKKLKNSAWFHGTKGDLKIENGKVKKTIYILKYEKGLGFRLIEEV